MHSQEGEGSVRDSIGEAHPKTTVHPGSSMLREALRRNIVSFPARVPVLLKQPRADMQWRMVLLYFVRGWSQAAIAARFGVPAHRIARTLNEWSIRALAFGYVQVIDSEECRLLGIECETDPRAEEPPVPGARPALEIAPAMFPSNGTQPEGAKLLASLDVAIAQCQRSRGEFWMGAAAFLTDLRAAAALAVEGERSSERPVGLFHAREEERVSHAAA